MFSIIRYQEFLNFAVVAHSDRGFVQGLVVCRLCLVWVNGFDCSALDVVFRSISTVAPTQIRPDDHLPEAQHDACPDRNLASQRAGPARAGRTRRSGETRAR